MGKHSEHGSQAKRKIKYLDIFKTIDHRPSTRELAGMMGISANQVSRDIRELALQEELNNIAIKTALHSREAFYKENYFSLPITQRPTTRQMAEELGISHASVARDINELSEKYGIEIAHSRVVMDYSEGFENRMEKYLSYFKELGYIPFYSHTAEYMDLPKKVVIEDYEKLGVTPITQPDYYERMFIKNVESRKDYYVEHYFQTFAPKTMREISDELNLYLNVVLKEIHYLMDTYGYFQYIGEKGKFIRFEAYKEYIDKHPMGFTFPEIAGDLGLSNNLVRSDFKEFGLVCIKNKDLFFAMARLPLYEEYNIKSDTPLNFSDMIKEMGISANTFYRDKIVLEQELGVKFKRVNNRRAFIKKENRIEMYADYIEKNGFVSYSDLARALNIHIATVLRDFKIYNLRDYFNIK